MAASGQVGIDLEAIRNFQASSPDRFDFNRYVDELWPWEEPMSEQVRRDLQASLPDLPSDVLEMFGVSRRFIAGELSFEWDDPDVQRASYGLLWLAIEGSMDYPRWRSEREGFTCRLAIDGYPKAIGSWVERRVANVELFGENHGRVVLHRANTHNQYELFYSSPTMAWSVSDLIACTLELYESGWQFERTITEFAEVERRIATSEWFEQRREQFAESPVPQSREERQVNYDLHMERRDEELTAVLPILDKWNCGDPTAPYEGWYDHVREPIHPVIGRMSQALGVEVRTTGEIVEALRARNPLEVASLLETFWESEEDHLGPGEQVTALDVMDQLGVPTVGFLDSEISKLVEGTEVSGNAAWTRFVRGRAIMRRREQQKEARDLDSLLAVTQEAVEDREAYLIWTARLIKWLGFVASDERARIDDVRSLLDQAEQLPNYERSGEGMIGYVIRQARYALREIR